MYTTQRFTAGRADLLDIQSVGDVGVGQINPQTLINSTPKEGNTIISGEPNDFFFFTNPYAHTGPIQLAVWSQIAHTPLRAYNENNEIENQLAKSIEVEDEFKTITVELIDAPFHNGDPITAEDVKFTFSHLHNSVGGYPLATQQPYDGPPEEAIEVIDDKTVVFNMARSFPPMATRVLPAWGIVHKESWVDGGAPESPGDFDFREHNVGSGPFRLVDMDVGGPTAQFEPFDDHPLYDVDHNLIIQKYQNEQSFLSAFQAGEIHFGKVSPGAYQNLEQSMGEDFVFATPGFLPVVYNYQCPIAPTKFTEFRQALARALDRQSINEQATFQTEPVLEKLCMLQDTHPWRPPDDMLTSYGPDPSGDVSGAKQLLRDAGWGFDDQGRLHYPQDADLSPLWPAESTPSPDDFSCLEQYPPTPSN